MYCKKCGTELRENDKFCYHCGYKTGIVQRIVSSKAFIGSMIALVVVVIAAVVTYFIMTGKLTLHSLTGQSDLSVTEIEDSAATEKTTPKIEVTAKPTATPYVFTPTDVTKQMKSKMKPLTTRLKPFLAYSASYYADGSHAFYWDDTTATTMALFNLEHYDKTVKYGDSMKMIQKKVKKEMKTLFGSHFQYKFEYQGTYPGYVYRPTGNTIVFNSTRIPGKEYNLKVKKIREYKEQKYRLEVEAYLTKGKGGAKGDIQRYTVMVEPNEESSLGYVVSKIKLSK